jgi:dipeptidyl aminopeptidase/acylaminoacyl peptidase
MTPKFKICLYMSCLLMGMSVTGVVAGPDENDIEGPSFVDVLTLKSIEGVQIAPDGSAIAYTVKSTDWDENQFDTEIWLVRDGEKPFQLTNTKDGSSSSPSWSPDSKKIAFLADRGDQNQIYLISADGGEAQKITDHEDGLGSFKWMPDGQQIVYAAVDPVGEDKKNIEERYGEFAIDDAEYQMVHLWITDVNTEETPDSTRLTSGTSFTVDSFSPSPDGKKVVFDHRPRPFATAYRDSDISIVDISAGSITPLVDQPGPDRGSVWSPDGKWIAFNTSMSKQYYFYRNVELAKIPADGGEITVLTSSFDEYPNVFKWTEQGIYLNSGQRSLIPLFLLNPEDGSLTKVADTPELIIDVSFSEDNKTAAVTALDRTTLAEVYKTPLDHYSPLKVTDMTAQVKDWPLGTREVIAWKSKDGTEIEGILWKPENYDPNRKYPLLVNIHGGPTTAARPMLIANFVYPLMQWLEKGALILEPNYRGSAGYGEAFRSLNVRNLGVGDAWDVESGVDHLISSGIVDEDRVGAMGWSQGGFISSFLSTNSSKFKAISMGAGISNWITYYASTDIHAFTRQYLHATPWDDPEVYAKTSPMTTIKNAQTPTLIQHGELDRRVPIANAYEMLQGLRDMGVETKLVVYKGFGHSMSKPKELLAANWHNWQWFAKYIWHEEIEIPH